MKAIAIIDKPKNCEECVFGICKYSLPLSTHRKAYYCQLKEPKGRVAEDFDYDEEVHLSNCPLKPMPEKKSEGETLKIAIENDCYYGTTEDEAYFAGRDKGYNACIDEILGDKE